MIFNKEEWVHRTILECSFLISKYTNEIINISSLVSALIIQYDGDVEKWADEQKISLGDKEKIYTFMKDKRVIVYADNEI